MCFPCNAHRIKRCRMTVPAWPEIDKRLSFQAGLAIASLRGIERRRAPHCKHLEAKGSAVVAKEVSMRSRCARRVTPTERVVSGQDRKSRAPGRSALCHPQGRP
jgi:hypothetical protein